MTLNYGIFDVSDPQNPDRVYSAALLSRILSKHIRDGIVHGDGNEMAVTATDPPAMTVRVGTGTAMVQGRFCENDAALTLSVPAAHATYPRIDRVVVRLNASPGRVIDILVKKGTPAPSPVPPGLTRTPETWELSLAQIFVAAGAKMVQAANITDERRDATLCGWACMTYLPSSQLEITGPVDMQGKALTGLPAPSGATDAARKGYVDEVIGGFGISQIAIDADKDWGGKSITNLKISNVDITNGRFAVTRKRSYAASDNVLYSIPTEVSKTGSGRTLAHQIRVPLGYLPSKFRIKFDFKYYESGAYHTGAEAVLMRDGVAILSVSYSHVGAENTWKTFSIDVGNVIGGELFQLFVEGGYMNEAQWSTGYVRNTRICGTEETFTQIIDSDVLTLWE